MKKLILTALVLVLGIIIFPSVTKAQYTPYVYNGGAYLNYALASQRARQMRNKHSPRKSKKRVSAKKKSAYRKNRRASLIENSINPEIFVSDLPKKSLIG